ncbi:MAG: M56 family metallopeptidase, partial [Ferruginibacter sp.]
HSLQGTLQKAPAEIRLFAASMADSFGIKRNIKIWYTNSVASPITYGFLKPIILLPLAMLSNLSLSETESVIIHELSHIQQKDYFFNWLVLVMQTLFFFNPFIFLLCHYIKLEREKQCDAQVLNFKYPAWQYAQTLVNIASAKKCLPAFSIGAATKKSLLLQRIEFFQKAPYLKNYPVTQRSFAVLILPLIIFFSMFFLPFSPEKKSIKLQPHISYSIVPGKMYPANLIEMKHSFETQPAQSSYEAEGVVAYAEEPSEIIKDDHPMVPAPEKDGDIPEISDPSIYYTASNAEVKYHEIIICEEASNGHKTTTVLKMEERKGKLTVKPLYTRSEIRNLTDSLKMIRDTIIKPFNIIQ